MRWLRQAGRLMADPDEAVQTRAVAEVMAAEALVYLTHPDQFGRFRLHALAAYPDDRDWLADLQPEILATLAEVLAPAAGGMS